MMAPEPDAGRYTVTIDVQTDSIAHSRYVLAAMEEAAAKLDAPLIGYGCHDDDGTDIPME